MSEPLGVEERARLRAEAENLKPGEFYPGAAVLALLDHVDRLTEALEAADEAMAKVQHEAGHLPAQLRTMTERAERAEADLAELRAGVEALAAEWQRRWDDPNDSATTEREIAQLRALLDTATEETP